MRAHDASTALEDALTAALTIQRFLSGFTIEQYLVDEVVRSAVERQFEILGEALGRALRVDKTLAEHLPEEPEVIGFRNLLAHAYDAVMDETVFGLAKEDLPALAGRLESLLQERP